jgi:hypothetical protein
MGTIPELKDLQHFSHVDFETGIDTWFRVPLGVTCGVHPPVAKTTVFRTGRQFAGRVAFSEPAGGKLNRLSSKSQFR